MPKPISTPAAGNEQGATTIPRMLQKWLDVNRLTSLTRTQGYFTIPAFSILTAFNGYSDIVGAFNYEGPNAFSITDLLALPASPSYLMCISWRDGGTIYRYKLCSDGTEIVYFPLEQYTGQLIKKNFRIEIWSTPDASQIQLTNIKLYTTVLSGMDYRYSDDFILVSADTLVIDFNNINDIFPLITDNLSYYFSADSGINVVNGYIVNWHDTINNFQLVKSGFGNTTTLETNPFNYASIGNYNDLVSGNFPSVPVKFIVAMINVLSSSAVNAHGNILDSEGVSLNYNNSTQVLTAFTSASIDLPALDTWYIYTLNILTGTISLYDYQTGELIDSAFGSTNTDPMLALYLGIPSSTNMNIGVSDVLIYTDVPYEQGVVNYLVQKYSTGITLPLTFPDNSISTTN